MAEESTLDPSGLGREAEREQPLMLASESETEEVRVPGWQRRHPLFGEDRRQQPHPTESSWGLDRRSSFRRRSGGRLVARWITRDVRGVQERARQRTFVVNADGTDLRQITPSGLGAISAQWSPNGDLIAFTSCASSPRTCFRTQAEQFDLGGSPHAWVVRPDGTGLREVTPLSLTPVWSPRQHQAPPQQICGSRPDLPVDRQQRRLPVSEADRHGAPDDLCLGQCAA
jgi:hypothetical protein